jgi:alcohol dehydrogenase class IV
MRQGDLVALISYLTTIEFEAGALSTLPAALEQLGVRRPLVVTDKGIVQAGLLDRLITALPEGLRGVPVFDGTPTNPTEDAVAAALALFRQQGCDGLVAFGGGSSIDLGKGVALLATHPGPLKDYALILGGLNRITAAVAPLIAVPTTAGTGSEVGRGALITLRDERKLGFISPHLIPRRAICDPELTIGLPPVLTAATGMDALAHCIETYLSPKVNPPADAIALDGAARAWAWIEAAVSRGSDVQARWHMMMASLHGALAFQKGLGAVHSMSHPLGGVQGLALHHGTLNAVVLPAVLRFNEGHAGSKYGKLKAAFGLPEQADLARDIAALNARIGLPPSLKAMGVPRELLPRMVAGAMADHSTATNPRPLTEDDFSRLFAEAFEG